MLPWIELGTAKIPGGHDLRLKRRGNEFSIMLGSNELMNSRVSASEKALATLACAELGDRASPHVLIGGLGMGFTLRAALEVLGPDARIVIAELVPAVIEWANGAMAEIFAGCLQDSRVTLVCNDVARLIAEARGRFDAILLDVDNGPDGLTTAGNDGLYGLRGLNAAKGALKPGGVLAVWSAHPAPAFKQRLAASGFACSEKHVRGNSPGRGAKHVIWLATRKA